MPRGNKVSQYRYNIIQYLLTVSSFQQEIQQLQEKLLNHVAFNPATLFEYIASQRQLQYSSREKLKYEQGLPLSQFKTKLAQKLKLKNGYGITAYLRKYQGKASFLQLMKLEHFLQTIVPYNPSVLRQSEYILTRNLQLGLEDYFPKRKQDPSGKQVQSDFKRIVKTYKQVATVQIHHILSLESMKQDARLIWPIVKEIILRDLKEKCKVIDRDTVINQTPLKDELTLNKVRKWLELNTSMKNGEQKKMTERCILNISRWCHGVQQTHLKKLFQTEKSLKLDRNRNLLTKKQSYHKSSRSSRKLQRKFQDQIDVREDIKNRKKQIWIGNKVHSQYYIHGNRQSEHNQHKGHQTIFQNQRLIKSQSLSDLNRLSERSRLLQRRQQDYVPDVKYINLNRQFGTFDIHSEEFKQFCFQKWLEYIKILVQSQKAIEFLNSMLQKHQDIQRMLDQVIGRSLNSSLNIEEIIIFIEQYRVISTEQKDLWMRHFSTFKLFRKQLRSILMKNRNFQSHVSSNRNYNYSLNTQDCHSAHNIYISSNGGDLTGCQIHQKGSRQVLANILSKYMSVRYELGNMARELQKGARFIFRKIDHLNYTYINKRTLTDFLELQGGKVNIKTIGEFQEKGKGAENSHIRKHIDQTKYKFTEADINVLFQYFGDGKIVTEASLERSLTVEALVQFHNR